MPIYDLGHVGGGESIKIGKTLVDKNGVINVSNPNNGIISQETYDQLNDEEKSTGTYIIPTDVGFKIISEGKEVVTSGSAGPDVTPIGTIISFIGMKPPKDYLVCDGSIHKKSDYPDLAAFFKEQFGSETYFGSNGDGTFAIPDMRNLFLRGYHGEATEQLSAGIGKKQEATKHVYILADGIKQIGISNTVVSSNFDTSANRNGSEYIVKADGEYSADIITNYTSRPVNMAVLYCIKAVLSESEQADKGEVYSEEETRIGTWIDGKPLYRRVFKGMTSGKINSVVTFGSNLGIDTFVNGWISVTTTLSFQDMGPGNYTNIYYNNSKQQIEIGIAHETYINCPLIAIIKYTKTTD